MGRFPGTLDGAVADWLEGRGGSLGAASAAMSARYRQGQASGGVDLAAYLTVRLPATYAVNAAVMREIAAQRPEFAPASVADIGAGPGTAGWAAAAVFAGVVSVTQVEATPAFAGLLKWFNGASGLPALRAATVHEQALVQWAVTPHDLVIASYVLAEMSPQQSADAVRKLWMATRDTLVLLEPGTPEGFRRIRAARDSLLGAGAVPVAPCSHAAGCPMAGSDWCHFKARVQRSRAHMHAKHATLPYEDEPYSYLVMARSGVPSGGARILAPVTVGKAAVDLTVCAAEGLRRETVPVRDKAAYKRAKKAVWGELFRR